MFISLCEYRDAMQKVARGDSYFNPCDLVNLRVMYEIMRTVYDHSCDSVCDSCHYVAHDSYQKPYCSLCYHQDMIASMIENATRDNI